MGILRWFFDPIRNWRVPPPAKGELHLSPRQKQAIKPHKPPTFRYRGKSR